MSESCFNSTIIPKQLGGYWLDCKCGIETMPAIHILHRHIIIVVSILACR